MADYIRIRFNLLLYITVFMFFLDFMSGRCYLTERSIAIVTNPVLKLILYCSIDLELKIKYIILLINILYEFIFICLSLYNLVTIPNTTCDNWFVYYRFLFNIVNIRIIYCIFNYIHVVDLRIFLYQRTLDIIQEQSVTISNEVTDNSISPLSFTSVIVPIDTWQCCICMSYRGTSIKLPCSHIVHYLCIIAWQNSGQSNANTCPLCRTAIPPLSALRLESI
jgi:hypothetical protein